MQTGYKILRSKAVRQRTQKRTQRGRKLGPKHKEMERLGLLKKDATLTNGKLAVEIMDEEIAKFDALENVLYPWDDNGKPLKGKSVQAFYWVNEMKRDYLALRAPFQTPRLSAVQVIPAGQAKRTTTVNVTILNEKGEQEFSDRPDDGEDLKLIEGVVGHDEEAA